MSAFFAQTYPLSLTGILDITSSPQTIPNATVGDTARFECRLNSVSASPGWNINGRDYLVSHLPSSYSFVSDSYSKILIVNQVHQDMNNTCIYCYILRYNGRVESSRAKLIIQPLVSSSISTYSLSSVRYSSLPIKSSTSSSKSVYTTHTIATTRLQTSHGEYYSRQPTTGISHTQVADCIKNYCVSF